MEGANRYKDTWNQSCKSFIKKWIKVIFYVTLTIVRKVFHKPQQTLSKLIRSHSFEEEVVKDKIVIVTGANKGIGKEVSFELAKRQATVIMACRNLESARQSIVDIRNKTFLGTLVPMKLDLASLRSVRNFVAEVQKKFDGIDILINNAAVMIPDDSDIKTEEGFNINVGTNYLGHFLLTNLLMKQLRRSSHAKVVILTSCTLKYGNLNFADLTKFEKKTGVYPQSYCNSKLALALFNRELSNRTVHLNVQTYCLCPGIVSTDVSQSIIKFRIIKLLYRYFKNLMFISPNKASKSVLYCAISKECSQQSGELYRHCNLWASPTFPDDFVVPGKMPHLSDNNARELWKTSEKLVDVDTNDFYI